MNVNKWGPGGWVFLHSITFNYPLEPTNDDKCNYRLYFESLGNILPCKYCRDSYKIYYKYIPIDHFLDSRVGVCYWLYRIHNLINDKIFCDNSSFEDFIRKYEDIRAKFGKMSRNGDLDKRYKTCKQKLFQIDQDYLNKFVNDSKPYEIMINEMIKKLYTSDENPNKECLKLKSIKNNNIIKIYYSKDV